MKKNVYNTPKIKVKPIDSEEILAGSPPTTNANIVPVANNGEEVNSKSTSMFDTDNDQLWK